MIDRCEDCRREVNTYTYSIVRLCLPCIQRRCDNEEDEEARQVNRDIDAQIRYLKSMILEMRGWGYNNVANIFADELSEVIEKLIEEEEGKEECREEKGEEGKIIKK